VALKNTRNSRAVQCNWKNPNCRNKTRNISTYCSIHEPLAARISNDKNRYASTNTYIRNTSEYVINQESRQKIYESNAQLLETYPGMKLISLPEGTHRVIISQLTKDEVAARGITITDKHQDGAVNSVSVTRDTKEEAIFEASAIAAEIWANRIDALSEQGRVDVYDSYTEAVAYARDWKKEITESEQQLGIESTGRSIVFSEDRKSKQVTIKIYHQSRENPTGFIEYDCITFQNKLRSVTQKDGSEIYIPHMVIDKPRSYTVTVDERGEPKRNVANQFKPITDALIAKVSKLVAESNKFGVARSDGKLQLPTGWELRSKNAGK